MIKTPQTTWFLKKCAGIKEGSKRYQHDQFSYTLDAVLIQCCSIHCRPGHDIVGKVHVKQIYEIAKMMMRNQHLSHLPHESVAKCVAGSCISMGLEVVKD